MHLLIINGPNLNLLGKREPAVYGKSTYQDLCDYIAAAAQELGVTCEVRQTNHEGVIVDWIQEADNCFDGIVINPAAYTHTSIAILDAIKAVSIPAVEVHLSDPDKREAFRHISYAGMACQATFKGNHFLGYRQAIEFLIKKQAGHQGE